MHQIQDKQGLIENISGTLQRLANNDNSDISKRRFAAFEAFKLKGLPGFKNEAYKYTPITKSLEKNFTFQEGAGSTLSPDKIRNYFIEGLEGNVLVFVNGEYSEESSIIKSPADQLIVNDFSSLFNGASSLATEEHADPFELLNTAMATAGVSVEVPKGKILAHPVILYYISDTHQGKITQQLKNKLTVGENAQASVIECYCGEGENANFSNTSTEIIVKESAVVDYYKVQNESPFSIHVDNTSISQQKNSVFTALTVTLNGSLIRNNLNIAINDEHCEANMFGLYLLNGKQHVDNQTVVDHKKPNCLSNELYKGIIDGNSTGVFNGKIFVRPDAQKTNAFQSNKNILLSDDATINTKPQLEIWADDVKCSHGATTGQLDEEQLFYLRARGLGKETARAMLLYAFAIDVLDKIKIPALKEYLDKIISGRLQNY